MFAWLYDCWKGKNDKVDETLEVICTSVVGDGEVVVKTEFIDKAEFNELWVSDDGMYKCVIVYYGDGITDVEIYKNTDDDACTQLACATICHVDK